MRVIAGTAKGHKLQTLEGLDTRPTTDRIKETLFNIIGFNLYDASFLDVFSGSGQIAIEALSRGAKEAYLIDNNKKAVEIIKENLKATKLFDNATIINKEFLAALNEIKHHKPFDFIFIDPPYAAGFEPQVLERIKANNLADPDTVIIIEADKHTDFSFVTDLGFEVTREKDYKTNKHIFLRRL
ncbi:MAG: 16S rRNA (guanine(966)-N(2))-methyltransferase RsmD [Lachnospiraceae bacterium]|nr:16S rRNA (guanine(966)-N(2))-methyltransferase RsmD [Lachnospiraceae bacterium]